MSTDQLLLQNVYKIEQVLGLIVTDVIDCVWGKGQAVVTHLPVWCALHDANNAFYNIVDVGKVAHTVAIVENLNGLTLHQLVGKAEIGHVWTACRTIDGEEAKSC